MSASPSRRTAAFAAFTLACLAAALLLPPLPQPLDYHAFVDTRPLWGIPNFMNVASNLAFVLAGVAGLVVVARRPGAFRQPVERWPFHVFFLGLALTGLGSAYYHLDPDNESLVWDRLPMTVAFAGLVSAQVADRIGTRAGLVVLPVLLAAGAASVMYWIASERAGAGNVVPYAILQGYTMAAVLVLALTHPSRYTRGGDIYWVFAAYLAAKVAELMDGGVWQLTDGLVSGHTLKHPFAALAGIVVCGTLLRREPAGPAG